MRRNTGWDLIVTDNIKIKEFLLNGLLSFCLFRPGPRARRRRGSSEDIHSSVSTEGVLSWPNFDILRLFNL